MLKRDTVSVQINYTELFHQIQIVVENPEVLYLKLPKKSFIERMQKLKGSWEEKQEEIFNHLRFYRFHLTIATIAMKNFGVKRKFVV